MELKEYEEKLKQEIIEQIYGYEKDENIITAAYSSESNFDGVVHYHVSIIVNKTIFFPDRNTPGSLFNKSFTYLSSTATGLEFRFCIQKYKL